MSRYRFELAGPADDADLRHILAQTPLPGPIAVAFHREPSYFAGARVDGRFRQVVAARDLDHQHFTPPAWLGHGYLGPGKMTLLTSPWKAGKTTLVVLLLARLQQGGQLAGLPVAGGKAFVISEESEADGRVRFQHLGIRDRVDRLCRPFTAPPRMDQWLALLETAAAWHQKLSSLLLTLWNLDCMK